MAGTSGLGRPARWVAVVNDLHKGRDNRNSLEMVIDGSAGCGGDLEPPGIHRAEVLGQFTH